MIEFPQPFQLKAAKIEFHFIICKSQLSEDWKYPNYKQHAIIVYRVWIQKCQVLSTKNN